MWMCVGGEWEGGGGLNLQVPCMVEVMGVSGSTVEKEGALHQLRPQGVSLSQRPMKRCVLVLICRPSFPAGF